MISRMVDHWFQEQEQLGEPEQGDGVDDGEGDNAVVENATGPQGVGCYYCLESVIKFKHMEKPRKKSEVWISMQTLLDKKI